MKKLAVGLVGIWMAGAVVTSIYVDVQRKANCIEHEGFLKGWLWCNTDPITRMEVSSNRIELFLKGLGWPVSIFRAGSKEQANKAVEEMPDSIATVATEEQFRSAMCALTEMPRDARETLRRAVREYLQDRDQSKMVRAIEVKEVRLHLSDCFQRHAVRTTSARTSDDDFKHFYNASERALLLTLMVDAVSKIADEQKTRKAGNEARIEIQQRNEQYYH